MSGQCCGESGDGPCFSPGVVMTGHQLTITVEVKAVCHDKPCNCEVGMADGQLRYLSWYQGAFSELPADQGKEGEVLTRVTALLMGMPEFDEETWSITAPQRR